jgi:hypothetical protein
MGWAVVVVVVRWWCGGLGTAFLEDEKKCMDKTKTYHGDFAHESFALLFEVGLSAWGGGGPLGHSGWLARLRTREAVMFDAMDLFGGVDAAGQLERASC